MRLLRNFKDKNSPLFYIIIIKLNAFVCLHFQLVPLNWLFGRIIMSAKQSYLNPFFIHRLDLNKNNNIRFMNKKAIVAPDTIGSRSLHFLCAYPTVLTYIIAYLKSSLDFLPDSYKLGNCFFLWKKLMRSLVHSRKDWFLG